MGPGKYGPHGPDPGSTECSNRAKLATGYSVTPALCEEHSSKRFYQSVIEGVIVGPSFGLNKIFTLFLN